MFYEITQQWQTWLRTPRARRTYRQWVLNQSKLQPWSLVSLGEPAFGDYSPTEIDDMQACLVRLSQSGCEQATLALTCQLMPGLRKLAKTTAKGFQESEAEVLSAFYEVLIGRDLEKRPAKIAANLLLDTKQRIYRAAQKEMRQFKLTESLKHTVSWSSDSTANPAEWIWTTGLLSSALDTYAKPKERELVGQIAFQHWIEGKPTKAISDSLSLSPTAVTTKLWRFRNKVRVMGQADLN